MGKRIYICNLPFSIEEEALESAIRDILGALGTVVSVRLVFEGSTLRPRGLCFAEMGNEEETILAISTLSGLRVAGRTLHASVAGPHLCPECGADSLDWDDGISEEQNWPEEKEEPRCV